MKMDCWHFGQWEKGRRCSEPSHTHTDGHAFLCIHKLCGVMVGVDDCRRST